MKTALQFGALGAVFFGAATSFAEPAATAKKPQVSGQLEYGIFTGDGEVNPYGVGLGVKGGYMLGMNVYLGAAFDYFFGETENVFGTERSANAWMLQVEGGYDFGVIPQAVIRPKLGIGMTSYSESLAGTGPGDFEFSDRYFALAPGAQFLYLLDPLFITAEARYNIVFTTESDETGDSPGASALILGAGVGGAF